MNWKTKAACGAALALLAGPPAFAQDTSTGADAATPAAPPLWLMSCSNQLNPEELMCEISQTIVLSEGNQRLATVSFTRPSGGSETGAVVLLPVGVSIPAGVAVSVDETPVGAMDYQNCDAQGCYATAEVDDAWLSAMREGEQMFLALKTRDGQDIRLAIQLAGFSKAEGMFP